MPEEPNNQPVQSATEPNQTEQTDQTRSVGRPVEYSLDMVFKTHKYLLECVDEEYQRTKSESATGTTFENKLKVKLPTIEGLAVYLGVHKDTIYDWAKKYPEFSDVFNSLKQKQAERLINMGLSGDYNPVIAKLLLSSKHDYVEQTKQEHSGEVKTVIETVKYDSQPSPDTV